MAVLLGIYIDMELKVSSQRSDPCKVTAKLINALWIYLHNSEDHIFSVLLRIKHTTKKYAIICDPIFTKSFSNLTKNVGVLTDMTYVKYLLALKMWKKMKTNSQDKKSVNEVAITILGQHMPKLRQNLLKFIPRPPMDHQNETLWLLQPNLFDLKQAREDFILLEEGMYHKHASVCGNDFISKGSEPVNFVTQMSTICNNIQNQVHKEHPLNCTITKDHVSKSNKNSTLQNSCNSDKSVNSTLLRRKIHVLNKRQSVPRLKPGEIIFIDLTEENGTTEICEHRKKRKKSKRKLEWLKLIRRKYKSQKKIRNTTYATGVEIADAHSTENLENYANRIILDHIPISDDKVSESTESFGLYCKEQPLQCINNDTDAIINRNEDVKQELKQSSCSSCNTMLKQDEMQEDHISCILKLLKLLGQNFKDPKVILNLIKRCKQESFISSYIHFLRDNADNFTNLNNHGKDLFSSERSSKESIVLSQLCQTCTRTPQYMKQEIPSSTNCNNMQRSEDYCSSRPTICITDCAMNNTIPSNSHNARITEDVKHNLQECATCEKNDIKPCIYNGNIDCSTNKLRDTMPYNGCNSVADKKSVCDKDIVNMLSDLDKCVDVLNRISDHIMSVHVEKQKEEKSVRTDMCRVSTTVCSDQTTESLDYWIQDINSLTSEKLNRILELHAKKEHVNLCKIKEVSELHKPETTHACNPVAHASGKYKDKNMTCVCKASELCLHESEGVQSTLLHNKSHQNCNCSHMNVVSKELTNHNNDIKKSEITAEHIQEKSSYQALITNTQDLQTSEPYTVESIHFKAQPDNEVPYKSSHRSVARVEKDDASVNDETNEFVNVDILDSILNGDMNIQEDRDIMEDSQSSMMSPISHDNSATVLNDIAEFFTQPDNTNANKVEGVTYDSSSEMPLKALPETSLGITGILNSLLDFDLTGMEFVPNDFMKNINDEMFSAPKSSNDACEIQSNEEKHLSDVEHLNPLIKGKDQQCNNKRHIRSGIDIVDFGLNANQQGTFEFPALEESLSVTENITLCQSPLLMQTNITTADLWDCSPKNFVIPIPDLATNTVTEHSYIFQKDDDLKEFQTLSDLVNHFSNDTCTSKDLSLNSLTNCLVTQCGDATLSSHSYIPVFPAHIKNSSLVESLSTSEVLDSIDLTSVSDTDVTTLQSKQAESEKSETQVIFQATEFAKFGEDPCVRYNKNEERSTKYKSATEICEQYTSKKKFKREKKISEDSNIEQAFQITPSNEGEVNVKHSQFTYRPFAHQTTRNIPRISVPPLHVSCQQKIQNKTYIKNKNASKDVRIISSEQPSQISQQKEQIVINFHKKSMPKVILSPESKNSLHVLKQGVSKESTILYKLRSREGISQSRKSYLKVTKGTDVSNDIQLSDTTIAKNKQTMETSNDVINVIEPKTIWSMQCGNTNSSRIVKKQMVTRASDLTSRCEETPMKKRRLTSKLSSLLEAGRVICSMSQQELQEKELTSMKKDFTYTGKAKYPVEMSKKLSIVKQLYT